MKTLSLLWTIIWNSPKAVYYISVALYYLPTVLSIVTKVREAFGSEAVQAVVKAVCDMIGQPAPAADSTGTISTDTKSEKRQRLFRFLVRTKVAGIMTDSEVNMACTAHKITPFEKEIKQWT